MKSNLEYQKTYRKKNPWASRLFSARSRCNNKNCPGYHRYGGRGIKCLLTMDEIKSLWFRDKAYNLEKPTIDRIDNDGNYTLENCRFIELSENASRPNREKKLCKHGHKFDYTDYKGWRVCTRCRNRWIINKRLENKRLKQAKPFKP